MAGILIIKCVILHR